MSLSSLHRSNPRRWLFTLMILLVAGVIFIWESQRHEARFRHVEAAAIAFVNDVCANRMTTSFTFADALVWSGAVDALKPMCAKHGPSALITTVRQGDDPSAGSLQGSATHVVTITAPDGKSISLRVRCDDPAAPVALLGYFIP